MISIDDLKRSPAPGGVTFVPHAGHTWGSGIVNIAKPDVEEFEAGKGLRHTKKGQLVFFVGICLLHELTHWLSDKAGFPPETGEKGNDFETEIYGAPVR